MIKSLTLWSRHECNNLTADLLPTTPNSSIKQPVQWIVCEQQPLQLPKETRESAETSKPLSSVFYIRSKIYEELKAHETSPLMLNPTMCRT